MIFFEFDDLLISENKNNEHSSNYQHHPQLEFPQFFESDRRESVNAHFIATHLIRVANEFFPSEDVVQKNVHEEHTENELVF